MKKFAFLLAFVMLVTLLASCGGENNNSRNEEDDVIMDAQDSQAMEAAQTAYADCLSENAAAECMLYENEGRFVALRNGTATGVFDSKETALTELFDDPDTTRNEAEDYICIRITGSAWYICCKDFRGLTYVAFGDSITYGIDGNYRSADANYKMAKPYPSLVGETLKMGAVNNQGVSGASFCPHPQRANMTQKILSFSGNADIISLMLGVNDFTSQLPLGDPTSRDNTTIYGCLYLISDHLTTLYPDIFIFYMTPFQYINPNNGTYKLEDVANAIKTVAAQYNIPVLDMYTYGKYELEMFVSPNDGVHPSQQHHIDYTTPLISEFIVRHYDSNYRQP